MGYSIYIGEAVIRVDREYGGSVDVTVAQTDGGPSFPGDVITGNTNSRSPSYSGWSEFCRRHHLYEMFFDEEKGLMREHPGVFLLTADHLAVVRAALDRHRTISPGAVPGWCTCVLCDSLIRAELTEPTHTNRDGDLARLLWLEHWISWALANCKVPAVRNS